MKRILLIVFVIVMFVGGMVGCSAPDIEEERGVVIATEYHQGMFGRVASSVIYFNNGETLRINGYVELFVGGIYYIKTIGGKLAEIETITKADMEKLLPPKEKKLM